MFCHKNTDLHSLDSWSNFWGSVHYRTLLQMKYMGWFETTKAIVIGRTCFESNSTGLSYEDAIKHALQDIPVIYDADVGHTVPRITMINGAILHLQYKNGKAALQFKLK